MKTTEIWQRMREAARDGDDVWLDVAEVRALLKERRGAWCGACAKKLLANEEIVTCGGMSAAPGCTGESVEAIVARGEAA